MGTIGERIKLVRTESGEKKMSMAAFAEKIGVTSGAVAQWETMQDRKPSSAVIKMIASEFNINETWLRTGEGEMKAPPTKEAEIASMAAEIINKDDPFRQRLIELIMQMDEDQMNHLKEMAVQLAKAAEE